MIGFMRLTINTYVNDTHIQLVPWVIASSTAPGQIVLQTNLQQDYILPMIGPNDSFRTHITDNFNFVGSASILYFGYAVRVLTLTAVPYFDEFQVSIKQNKTS